MRFVTLHVCSSAGSLLAFSGEGGDFSAERVSGRTSDLLHCCYCTMVRECSTEGDAFCSAAVPVCIALLNVGLTAWPAAVVLESFAKGDAPGSAAMPACIVLERWDYSLSDWNNKLQRQPDDIELQSALYMVSPCPHMPALVTCVRHLTLPAEIARSSFCPPLLQTCQAYAGGFPSAPSTSLLPPCYVRWSTRCHTHQHVACSSHLCVMLMRLHFILCNIARSTQWSAESAGVQDSGRAAPAGDCAW